MKRILAMLALVFIILLALGFRIWGIGWGLPTETHYYSYHPDENMVLGAAMAVNPFNGELDPGFYNYGSLYIFLTNIAVTFGSAYGAIEPASGDIYSQIGEVADMYMAGRIVALILGILTVFVVYFIGRRAYGRWAGLLAALLMAVLPIHVMHSKFLAVDVPATFFVCMALLFTLRIPQEGFRLRDYLLAGLFAGLAAGTKYNAGLVIISPILIHLTTYKARPFIRAINPKLISILVMAAVGFIIGTPGVLLNTEAFARDFGYELFHARTGHGLVFEGTGLGWVYHFLHSLWPGMGLPLLVLSVIGVIYALKKRSPGDVALLSFLLVYYLAIGAAQVRFARYIIPITPVLILLAARVSVEAIQRFFADKPAPSRITHHASRTAGLFAILLLIAILGYTALYSAAIDSMYTRPDTRDRAADWIEMNIPPRDSIGFATIPWFYTPPLEPSIGLQATGDARYTRALEVTEYKLQISHPKEWDATFLEETKPSFVVLSSFEYEDRLRLRSPDVLQYFDMLKRDYSLERRFADAPKLSGKRFPIWRKLPHDMSYASPTILIYSRNTGG